MRCCIIGRITRAVSCLLRIWFGSFHCRPTPLVSRRRWVHSFIDQQSNARCAFVEFITRLIIQHCHTISSGISHIHFSLARPLNLGAEVYCRDRLQRHIRAGRGSAARPPKRSHLVECHCYSPPPRLSEPETLSCWLVGWFTGWGWIPTTTWSMCSIFCHKLVDKYIHLISIEWFRVALIRLAN